MEWTDMILAIIAGLSAAIPLVIKLVEYVRKAIKERNWSSLLELVMAYMAEAERRFEDGADRKEWVMGMIAASAHKVEYDIDMEVVSRLIDELCGMAKVVNAPEVAE